MRHGKLRVLDLFSGIGGFSLGLEETGGFETVAFCEIDAKARAVLAKHWPAVKQYHDITTLTKEQLDADGIEVDVICGGFPCQDLSLAGKGAGLEGARSGLWYEFLRLIAAIRPRYALIENVSALRSRGLEEVLRGLAEIGFDAEWHCIPASAVGAHHQRDRLWVVAYPNREPLRLEQQRVPGGREDGVRDEGEALAVDARVSGPAPHADRVGAQVPPAGELAAVPLLGSESAAWRTRSAWWVEPDVVRVVHGLPARMDRIKQLGNAVVPEIPRLIGLAILQSLEK